MPPIRCFPPCLMALSAIELPPGTLLVFCQSVPKKMHADIYIQIHARMSAPITPTAAFIKNHPRFIQNLAEVARVGLNQFAKGAGGRNSCRNDL